ncbi:MAG: ascorbate transporter subunit [Rhodoglobus sp.]|nr:ascorbate transporter subunit [Rhodoglobus sp.]
MKIVTICGAGIGSSGILKVNAERVLRKLDISAEVVAADIASVREVAADAQVILTSAEFVDAIGKTNASVIVIENYFDTAELTTKLETALGS